MELVRPMKVLNANLVSSDVAEPEETAWSAEETVTITNASPAVMTVASGKKIAPWTPIKFSTTGALPSPLVAGTQYYFRQSPVTQTSATGEIATSVNGSAINTTTAGSGTHTVTGPKAYHTVGERVSIVSPAFTFTVATGNRALFTIAGPITMQLADDLPVTLSTTGALLTGLTAGQLYYIRDYAYSVYGNVTFRLADKAGGTPLSASGTQSGTHTLTVQEHGIYELITAETALGSAAAYVGISPLNDLGASPAIWERAFSTNRWRMFDDSVSSQTSAADAITVQLAADGYVDTIVLLNISATSAHLVITDATDGVVYDQTVDLMDYSGIIDELAYCFDPVELLQDYAFTGLPHYPDSTIDITLTNTGDTALCGAVLLGQVLDVGGTQYGGSVGIQDYSQKTQDDWGNYAIQERAFNRRANFNVTVECTLVDQLFTTLSKYRATPICYIGSPGYTSTIMFGFFDDFDVLIQYPTMSICNISLRSLT